MNASSGLAQRPHSLHTQRALVPLLLPAVLMRRVRAQGERVTWAKLPAIQANCGIEMTLDACMLELSEVMAMKKQVAGLYRVARGSHGHHGHHHGQPPVLARMSPGAGPKMSARQRIPSWINLSAMGLPLFTLPTSTRMASLQSLPSAENPSSVRHTCQVLCQWLLHAFFSHCKSRGIGLIIVCDLQACLALLLMSPWMGALGPRHPWRTPPHPKVFARGGHYFMINFRYTDYLFVTASAVVGSLWVPVLFSS